MALFDFKTTADTMNMLGANLKHKTGVSFLAVDGYGYARMVTFVSGVLTIEDRFDSYEYTAEFVETSSGKFLAIANDEEIILSISKTEGLKESEE